MTKLNLPLEGACRCGNIRLKISAPPLVTMACHCTGCQRMSGSAYSLSAAIPSDGFEVIAGTPVASGKSPDAGHHFCPDCMTWMFTRPQGMDFFVNLRPTMLDDTSWYSPFIETFTSEKLAFAATGAEHSYPKFPPMEDFEGLIAGYAAR
ncbi:GFA family protein [Pararhizobium antarcticum]|uniref:Aldehyde-activating protein n=1 Tax=Pararhizobium antarcticum TaxID=1798805 RepID=A0A657LN53_9HYPH|nr:GFA family protein [Pararhizobium antarcticum]OJF91839.1 aldehyde-activating protein [Pararhizobium antarcticum]OJF92679.1 aldehyde-activating protein [Rhizobium sp. 58]